MIFELLQYQISIQRNSKISYSWSCDIKIWELLSERTQIICQFDEKYLDFCYTIIIMIAFHVQTDKSDLLPSKNFYEIILCSIPFWIIENSL